MVSQNNKDVYYRITYNGEGVYNALKNSVNIDIWKNLLNDSRINWLPKPPEYSSKNISYFTQKGYELFCEKTLPIINEYLDNEKIKIESYHKICNIILYFDEYQVVIETHEK